MLERTWVGALSVMVATMVVLSVRPADAGCSYDLNGVGYGDNCPYRGPAPGYRRLDDRAIQAQQAQAAAAAAARARYQAALLAEQIAEGKNDAAFAEAQDRAARAQAAFIAERDKLASMVRGDSLGSATAHGVSSPAGLRGDGDLVPSLRGDTPTSAPSAPPGAVPAQVAADRAKLATLLAHRAVLEHALQLIEREGDRQRENARDQASLQRAVTQDLVSDSLGALTSDAFMGPLHEVAGVSTEGVERVKETLDAARDVADAYALYDASRGLNADPNDSDLQDRKREKLIGVLGSAAGRVLGAGVPPALKEDVKTFVAVETEAVTDSKDVASGRTFTRVAASLDAIAGFTGAVIPEIGALRSVVGATEGSYVLYVVHDDAKAISAAQAGIAKAQTALEFRLSLVEARQADLQKQIARETPP